MLKSFKRYRNDKKYNTIQFIDLRRRNSLLVRLRDRDVGNAKMAIGYISLQATNLTKKSTKVFEYIGSEMTKNDRIRHPT